MVKEFSKSFGAHVKAQRLQLGLRQDMVVAMLQKQGVTISQSYLSRLESGQRLQPSIHVVVSLTVLLNISLDTVLQLAMHGENHESDEQSG